MAKTVPLMILLLAALRVPRCSAARPVNPSRKYVIGRRLQQDTQTANETELTNGQDAEDLLLSNRTSEANETSLFSALADPLQDDSKAESPHATIEQQSQQQQPESPVMAAARDNTTGGSSGNSQQSALDPSMMEEPSSMIVGGSKAEGGRFPYMALLWLSSGRWTCGGTLIAPNVVLSAAHCADMGKIVSVQIGRYDLSSGKSAVGATEETFAVNKVVVHPLYRDPPWLSGYDVLLLRLDGSSAATPVRLMDPEAASGLSSKIPLRVVGWGLTASGSTSDVLLEAAVHAVPLKECRESWDIRNGATVTISDESEMCATAESQSFCKGDSGGPLLVPGAAGAPDQQIGVVSWGPGDCESPSIPGVFANVLTLRTWIVRKLCRWTSSPSPAKGINCT